MGKMFRITFIFIIVVVILFAGKNMVAKVVVEQGVQAALGLPLKIKKFDIGASHVGITELNLFSPAGFSNEVMFHAPEIFVDYNFGDLLKGKIHLEDIRLDFDKFVIVKNKEGQTNIDALRPKKKEAQPKETTKDEGGSKKKGKAPKIQIDHLSLKIGKVIYKDYSKDKLTIKEFTVNISEEMNDVTDLKLLASTIATKAIAKAALNTLVDFNMDALKDASAVPMQAIDTLKNTAETLRDVIKLPFGNN